MITYRRSNGQDIPQHGEVIFCCSALLPAGLPLEYALSFYSTALFCSDIMGKERKEGTQRHATYAGTQTRAAQYLCGRGSLQSRGTESFTSSRSYVYRRYGRSAAGAARSDHFPACTRCWLRDRRLAD